MSGKSNIDFIDGKRIKLKDTREKITNFGATCRISNWLFQKQMREVFHKTI